MTTFNTSNGTNKAIQTARLAKLAARRSEWLAGLTNDSIVRIDGIEGTHRFCGFSANGKWADCVKQSDVAIERAKGAAYRPHDRGPSRLYETRRLRPV